MALVAGPVACARDVNPCHGEERGDRAWHGNAWNSLATESPTVEEANCWMASPNGWTTSNLRVHVAFMCFLPEITIGVEIQ